LVFGKIEYLNLLPFHVFMKRFTSSSQQKMSMHYKRGVPAKINDKFLMRKVDAAFISSIKAKKYKYVNLGIVAKKEVLSVILIPQNDTILDQESASSNILANLLGLQGKVLIGDKALRYSLEGKKHIDLAQVWNEKYNLPFVFALLCYHNHKKTLQKIEASFMHQKIYIPQYILNKEAQRTQISSSNILKYLEHISYVVDTKARRGLKKFYTLSK